MVLDKSRQTAETEERAQKPMQAHTEARFVTELTL